MVKITWSPVAVERLNQIYIYISQDSADEAKKFRNLIFKSIEKLEDLPKIGRIVPERNQNNIREIFVKKYRVIYKIKEDSIEILTIFHGSRLFHLK
jgi:toxin ParE1/3/4